MERGRGEAAPAFHPGNETDVQEEGEGHEILGNDDRDRRTYKAQTKVEDQKPVLKCIQWRCEQQDIEGGRKEALRLHKAFPGLERSQPGSPE